MRIELKYGCNPHQEHASASAQGEPLRVLNGRPSYINLLDGLRSWQLVRELKAATGEASAASFKHVSPAGAAVAGELSDEFAKAHLVRGHRDLSPVASAYARARSSDRVASFGDFVAVSEPVDASLAGLLKSEVSDGIIAPAYDDDALAVLSAKKGGKYVVLQIDPDHEPPATEARDLFGVRLEQAYDDAVVDASTFSNVVTQRDQIPGAVMRTLIVTTLTLKHTQSNSVAIGLDGQAVGVGAGQQSRIACTRLACEKADRWLLKLHPKTLGLQFAPKLPRAEKVNVIDSYVRYHELNDIERGELVGKLAAEPEPISESERADWLSKPREAVLSSDAFIPFRDNLDRAAASGVRYVAHAGGSARDDEVTAAADEHQMVMALTGLRLFLH
jgi:AICAR transformylase/IMP cyclohydrolase PurH